MKDLVEFIIESQSDYTIKNITVDEFIKKLKNYPTIAEHADEELDEDGIIYVNGRNTAKNVYTNLEKNSPYQWIVLMNGNKEVAIQLLKFEGKDEIELVIAERSKKAKDEHDTFKKILDAVIEKYHPKKIHTFALADKLKEKYMSYGFKKDSEDQLTLDVE